ncbi:uncharacterized protein LOC125369534 [Ricinus communis]|uniref:uncharacterized protein LOC125369534 n=1 Tax=Ricinus communis TaxID=3988 RepID=UPI00201A28CA|nr:uncharacterized protein LOC125369534 [Ricinus communis]
MSNCARFLKEILSNKRKLEDLGLVTLNEECSAILQNKLPVKWRDPRSFTVPCIIDDLHISDALVGLGSSINLMPTSFFEKLGLSEPKPTRMRASELADRGESSIPLILGRPFLATSRNFVIMCVMRSSEFRVDNETITFDLSTSMRHLLDHDDTVYSVDVLDDNVGSQLQKICFDFFILSL